MKKITILLTILLVGIGLRAQVVDSAQLLIRYVPKLANSNKINHNSQIINNNFSKINNNFNKINNNLSKIINNFNKIINNSQIISNHSQITKINKIIIISIKINSI